MGLDAYLIFHTIGGSMNTKIIGIVAVVLIAIAGLFGLVHLKRK